MGEMPDPSDAQLLRAYVESGQDTTFREIVTRHADLVYSAALRQVNSPDLARDLAVRERDRDGRCRRRRADGLPTHKNRIVLGMCVEMFSARGQQLRA